MPACFRPLMLASTASLFIGLAYPLQSCDYFTSGAATEAEGPVFFLGCQKSRIYRPPGVSGPVRSNSAKSRISKEPPYLTSLTLL
jgi:hypothetical protein